MIVSFLGRRPGWAALSVTLLAVNIAIELALPQILGNAITGLRDPLTASSFPIARSVLVFVFLVIVRTCVGRVLGPIRNRTAQQTLGDIRAAVYAALQKKTFAWHDNVRTGELISRAGTDVGRLQELIFVCLLFSVDVTAGLVGTLLLIFWVHATLGWIALASMVPTVAAMAFFAVRLQPRWRRVHEKHGAMSSVIQENIAGVRVVKAFAQEEAEIFKFRMKREAFLHELSGAVSYWAARVPFAQFLFGLGLPLVLWVGGQQVLRREILIGDLAKVVFYLLALGGRIGVIGQITNIIQSSSSAAQRVCDLLGEDRETVSLIRASNRVLQGSVQFDGVGFVYDSEPSLKVECESPPVGTVAPIRSVRPVALEAISFEVAIGETVALVGATGSGKSTLLSLIPAFYSPSFGVVRIDGQDVRDFDLAHLRRSVAVVFQETFLFSASVAENISFGAPNASRADVQSAALVARANDFIEALANGYDTLIGERGVSLSGGQRQRLAIARAVLMNPRIILLDDATSAIDSKTEHEIQEAMSEVCRGRTTFVVAHRLSTVRRADRILVLQSGRLVGQGTHNELMAHNPVYQDLFAAQMKSSSPTITPAF